MSVSDNVTGSPQTVALSGSATGLPTIQISPSSLSFAPQSVGIPSAAQTITVLNSGAGPLSINGISVTGTNAADFSETNNCPPSLAPGASCTVGVVFLPSLQAAASRAAVLDIADNATGSPQAVPLAGSATAASISISPASLNFGGQLAGTAGQPQAITVTNNGTGALSFSSIAVSGAVDFVVGANTCKGANIPAAGTCTVQLTFSPACTNGAAARSATLVLTDNVAGSPQNVPVSGMATGDFCFDPSSTATVTAGQTATYALVVDSATAYKGSVSLACAGIPATTTCTAPASVSVPSQFTVSVSTAASSVALPSIRRAPNVSAAHLWLAALIIILIWAWAFGVSRHAPIQPGSFGRAAFRWVQFAVIPVALFGVSLWLDGCGGGSAAGDPSVPGTPAGTYSFVLSGTSTNTTAQVTLTLTVQ